jgi:hypothetical protein
MTSVSAIAPATTSVPMSPPPAEVRAPGRTHLVVKGADFFDGESRFVWRGISAFRLVELTGRAEADAIAYLDWARGQRLTVVRVLTMATQLFQLSPDAGLKALPRLLSLAAERGLFVEVVALADTGGTTLDLAQHVKAVGVIAAAHTNALVEIANEPYHPTQDVRLHNPAFVASLVELIPASVPVAAGSLEGREGYAEAGRYATWHAPRSAELDGWGHVLELTEGAVLISRFQKPVISDEPIGAGEEDTLGRRDNEPRRFGAGAVVTRLAGLGTTFHYEGGLLARIPVGKELECFQAWSQGLDAVAGLPAGGRFLAGADLASVAGVTGARAVFGRVYDKEVWVVLVDPGEVKVEWKAPWREASRVTVPGAVVVRALRGV